MKTNVKLPLYELDLKEFRKQYDYGDFCMLEYIEPFITDDLNELYKEVLDYNEIYANGWTINELLKMGEKDSYWLNRADNFIKKYKVPKKDFDNYSKYFDKYTELRDELLDTLGIDNIYRDLNLNDVKFSKYGILESEMITNPKEIKEECSYTVARIRSFGYCLELHYSNKEVWLEYGYKTEHDCWDDEIEEIDWFNINMSDEAILNKLWELFDEYFNLDIKSLEKGIE